MFFDRGVPLWELLIVEDFHVIKKHVLYVAVTHVAPKAKVGKAKHNRVVLILSSMRINHVRFNVAGACNGPAVGFQTNPVFAFVVAFDAGIVDASLDIVFDRPDILWGTVVAVAFGANCEESFYLHMILIIG